MPREREFDPDAALDAAMQVFWRKGYSESSMNDLVAETGVSRYGLYSQFGDKHGLFLAALDRYCQINDSFVLSRLERPNAAAADIRWYFETMSSVSGTARGELGCLMCNTALEFSATDAMVSERVGSFYDRTRAAFRNALGNAVSAGELRGSLDLDAYSNYLVGVSQGLMVSLRSAADPEVVAQFLSVALRGLDSDESDRT